MSNLFDANAWGRAAGRLIDAKRPMGSWTGLPPALGAPLSGAMWGAGLGTLAGAILHLRDERKKRMSLAAPAALGGLLGLGLGAYSAAMRGHYKQTSFGMSVEERIRRAHELTAAESARTEHAYRMASPADKRRVATMLASGASAAAVARFLGVNLLGSALVGAGTGWAVSNFLTPKQRHVV